MVVVVVVAVFVFDGLGTILDPVPATTAAKWVGPVGVVSKQNSDRVSPRNGNGVLSNQLVNSNSKGLFRDAVTCVPGRIGIDCQVSLDVGLLGSKDLIGRVFSNASEWAFNTGVRETPADCNGLRGFGAVGSSHGAFLLRGQDEGESVASLDVARRNDACKACGGKRRSGQGTNDGREVHFD